MDGKLLVSRQSRFGQKVFYVESGRRHWIFDAQWICDVGFSWPNDVIEVEPWMLELFTSARPIGRRWSTAERMTPPRLNVLQMRSVLCSHAQGYGIEFGPGANPLPIPQDCRVQYADKFSIGELSRELYVGQTFNELINPDFQIDFEDMSSLSSGSLDFIAAAHVIEHLADPVGAMVSASEKLVQGGWLLLAVPDKRRTFDRRRALTTVDHLMLDFEQPSRERDSEHYKEFYRLAFPTPSDDFDMKWRASWNDNFPIHYHTFVPHTFRKIGEFLIKRLGAYRRLWIQETLPHEPDCNEFWVGLQK